MGVYVPRCVLFSPLLSTIELPDVGTDDTSLYIQDDSGGEINILGCGNTGHFEKISLYECGPGSSVGIATDYGLGDPGSNPGGDEIFRPSGRTLWPTQPPVKWVPGLSRR